MVRQITDSHRQHLAESHRKYALDESAFDALTPDSLYWAGFIMGDGCITQPRRGAGQTRLVVCVTESDSQHIDSLRAFLKTDKPLQHRPATNGYANSKPSVRLEITSVRLATALARFGVVPRKSLSAKGSDIANGPDWWRGLVDADGQLRWSFNRKGWKAPMIGLCGSQAIVTQFADYCKEVVGYRGKPHKSGSIFFIALSHQLAAKMIRQLYGNAEVALPRKQRVAQEILSDPRYANPDARYSRAATCRKLAAFGKEQSIREWSLETGLSIHTISGRLKLGWPAESALTAPRHEHKRMLTFNGLTLHAAEWARRLGINQGTLIARLRHGFSVEDALTLPNQHTPKANVLMFRGQAKPLKQWARELNLHHDTLYSRIFDSDWDVERALTTPTRPYNSRAS